MVILDCMEDIYLLKALQRFVSMDNGHMLVVTFGILVTALSFVGIS